MPRLLTDRQADALRLVCEGASERTIAEELGIAPATARKLVGLIRQRLQATQPMDLCALGAEDVAASTERALRRTEQS
jgi:DNA-binding CsgD family transcriptional regulator